MRARGALLGSAMALAATGLAHGQALDSRSALFDAAFAHPAPIAKSFATAPQSFVASAYAAPAANHAVILTAPGAAPQGHAIAFTQPTYLTASDEGALDFSGAGRPTLSLSGGGYEFAFVPQGSVDAGGGASSAQAGAMVRVGTDIQDKVMTGLTKLGMHTVTSEEIKDRSRVYMFAAYSGREIGFNIARGSTGGLQRLGWSAEGASTLVSDAQAGVGWRKGALQASVGYVHRDVNSNYDNGFGNVGMQKLSDNMVAFTLSFHPH